ncbi:huntingtin-interacting protein K-like [Teleopsis dalmanni]|uniref:huntingtin-interacting protein K-like n=1 Tax=Teleopsis dalmanni TaxID=139649 RepID=UPI000D32BB48|nr:huntingtin-interacting protein K-like [Teleopsis dalmanni]XP_037952128.1 huntingtin-interacting protein K-like [Teleopsis dalmanni]
MSEHEINGGDDEVQDKKQKKQTRHDGGAADLERVTDYAEEKEISAANISSAVEQFGNQRSKEDELKVAKEKELQKVHVKKEDIEIIMNEMLITKAQAEKVLREQSGDLVAALEAIIAN